MIRWRGSSGAYNVLFYGHPYWPLDLAFGLLSAGVAVHTLLTGGPIVLLVLSALAALAMLSQAIGNFRHRRRLARSRRERLTDRPKVDHQPD